MLSLYVVFITGQKGNAYDWLKIPAVFNQPINSRLQHFARDFSFLHGISRFCTEIPSRFKKNCILINRSEYSIFEQYVIKSCYLPQLWGLTAGEIEPYSRNGIRNTEKHVL